MVKKDASLTTDVHGLLKIGTKTAELSCDASSELKLRAAWQRRSLAMDLAEIASYETVETWIQYLFAQFVKEQPKGFARIALQQVLECDRQLFILASRKTMGKLRASAPGDPKPLDQAINELKASPEILQYLAPLPAVRAPPTPAPGMERPAKVPKTAAPKQGNKSPASGSGKFQLPEGCVSHDDENGPLCFLRQQGKCKFKGPPGKRCARGYHKCYKAGCFRLKPYHLCTHTDWLAPQTVSHSANSSPPLIVEVFAGRASLSRALIDAGFQVLSVDREVDQPFAPLKVADPSFGKFCMRRICLRSI